MKALFVSVMIGAAMSLTACGTTNTKTTTNSFSAVDNAKTLLVRPDVELKILMASGLTETRADWSKQGEENLSVALESAIKAKGGQVQTMDLSQTLTPEQVQVIKLNDAVITTSLSYDYIGKGLPTHEDLYSRSVGPGASALSNGTGSDYALLVKAGGSYSSGGKVAMNIAMAALGGPIQLGGQQLFASLVDLETGDIVWSNLANAASNADMRDPEGAQRLVESVLEDFPL